MTPNPDTDVIAGIPRAKRAARDLRASGMFGRNVATLRALAERFLDGHANGFDHLPTEYEKGT